MSDAKDNTVSLEVISKIVSAYVSNNTLPASELPDLIRNVHEGLVKPGEARSEPAVPVKKSVRPDYIICLDDGKKLKMLKRHLRTAYNMTPDEYRAKWQLGPDYPMVAPNYAKQRSVMAMKIGFGRKPGAKVKARRKASR